VRGLSEHSWGYGLAGREHGQWPESGRSVMVLGVAVPEIYSKVALCPLRTLLTCT
jgi:hypothetical protein